MRWRHFAVAAAGAAASAALAASAGGTAVHDDEWVAAKLTAAAGGLAEPLNEVDTAEVFSHADISPARGVREDTCRFRWQHNREFLRLQAFIFCLMLSLEINLGGGIERSARG